MQPTLAREFDVREYKAEPSLDNVFEIPTQKQ